MIRVIFTIIGVVILAPIIASYIATWLVYEVNWRKLFHRKKDTYLK